MSLSAGVRGAALAAAGSLGLGAAAYASTPVPIWKDMTRLGVHCRLQSEGAPDPALLVRLCGEVRAAAAPGAPAPVVAIPPGDPALVEAGTVALLADFAVQRSAEGERLLLFTLRPWRAVAESNTLFGSAPRAVPLSGADVSPTALRPALSEALSEILPWRAGDPRFRIRPLSR